MKGDKIDRPGLIVFLPGVAILLASIALGFYLRWNIPVDLKPTDWHQASYDADTARVARIYAFLWDLDVLMWLTFASGIFRTLIGLRMLTRRNFDLHPILPLGSIRKVFENPE